MLVNCAFYADGRRVTDLPVEQISEYLQREDGFVWVGLHEPDPALLRQIQQEFGLHDLAVEDAERAHQRPKLEEYGQCLFVVLRTVQPDGKGGIAFGETHIFVGPRFLVSVRHGASLPYKDVRARCEAAPHLLKKGPGFALYAIMDFVVDQYFPIIDALEDDLESIEESIFERGMGRDVSERLYKLKRALLGLKRAIAPLMEVTNRLVRFDVGFIADDARVYFRDVYDHVIRINESVDTLRELLTSALEANLSIISISQNEVMKQLGSWAAILAVPTLIAGIYGMNFKWIPEFDLDYGYPVALVVMVASSGFLYWRFKRSSWL